MICTMPFRTSLTLRTRLPQAARPRRRCGAQGMTSSCSSGRSIHTGACINAPCAQLSALFSLLRIGSRNTLLTILIRLTADPQPSFPTINIDTATPVIAPTRQGIVMANIIRSATLRRRMPVTSHHHSATHGGAPPHQMTHMHGALLPSTPHPPCRRGTTLTAMGRIAQPHPHRHHRARPVTQSSYILATHTHRDVSPSPCTTAPACATAPWTRTRARCACWLPSL